jgi:hypothetical protein
VALEVIVVVADVDAELVIVEVAELVDVEDIVVVAVEVCVDKSQVRNDPSLKSPIALFNASTVCTQSPVLSRRVPAAVQEIADSWPL